ncbi:hypothetical protein Lal_00021850 [Lupinus albus]|nr:hypothetical protein Lal_00021850 [Lupinus albus]
MASIINIIHCIWYYKNQSIFEENSCSIQQAIIKIKTAIALSGNSPNLFANNSIRDFSILKDLNISINYTKAPIIIEIIWKAPSRGWIKVSNDGAAHGAPSHAGGGGIFRDHSGCFLACFANYLDIQDALFVELHTSILAIELAVDKGRINLWLECHSSLVVNIFIGKAKPLWKLLNRWLLCKNMVSSMSFKISHIYREGNSCANKLTIFALSSKSYSW